MGREGRKWESEACESWRGLKWLSVEGVSKIHWTILPFDIKHECHRTKGKDENSLKTFYLFSQTQHTQVTSPPHGSPLQIFLKPSISTFYHIKLTSSILFILVPLKSPCTSINFHQHLMITTTHIWTHKVQSSKRTLIYPFTQEYPISSFISLWSLT